MGEGPLVLVGGIDPTGGAGLIRDAWTARTLEPSVPLRCIVTALTRQGDGRPARAWPTDPARFADQLEATASPVAVKLGLVPAPLIDVCRDWLVGLGVPVVIDPVIAATDGGELGATAESLRRVAPCATVVTPNWPEAIALGGHLEPDAVALAERLTTAVLLKGGHQAGSAVIDSLGYGGQLHRFERSRQPGPNIRGTGCALATAIAVGLARGNDLVGAVGQAIAWLDRQRSRAVAIGGQFHLPAAFSA